MTVVTRFAPSPTGRLHVGNVRAALQNWAVAKAAGGRFWLRLDDTDRARSTEEFAQAIREDLNWMGLVPDGEVRQSDRFDRYEAVFEQLRAAGRIYPAYETPEELEIRRKVLLGRGLPPIYDRAALALSDDDRARLEAEGRRPHWRFRLEHDAPIVWDDAVRGAQSFDPKSLGDPVIRRADGSWLYLLPSVIDDADMGVTQVIRGEDHVANTALQLQMFAAMGAIAPNFAHAALLTGTEGKLSKRLGSLGMDSLREGGVEPEALLSLLARIGTSRPVEPLADVGAIAAGFDLSTLSRAPARFDEAELAAVNAKVIHQLSFDRVAARLPVGMDAAAWAAIRPNLNAVAEAADWWAVVTGPVAPPPLSAEERDVVAAATEAAEAGWPDDPWHALTGAAKTMTGAKGRALFLPLRRVLTGRDHGPDMAALLPLIGRDETLRRLRAAMDE